LSEKFEFLSKKKNFEEKIFDKKGKTRRKIKGIIRGIIRRKISGILGEIFEEKFGE